MLRSKQSSEGRVCVTRGEAATLFEGLQPYARGCNLKCEGLQPYARGCNLMCQVTSLLRAVKAAEPGAADWWCFECRCG